MYNAYFGFARRPFTSAAQVDRYFPATVIEAARQTLARCIERGEGAALVVGPSGTGKTLLCQVLAEQSRDSRKVALLSSGRLSTRRNLFQAILYELNRPYRGMDEGELRLALVDHLTVSEDCARGIVLLVDEAQSLPLRLLEEIRMLTNVAREGQPQVRLVIAGGCALEERLAHPKLDCFSQRLVARCYLESLGRDETQQYIHARVDSALPLVGQGTSPAGGRPTEAIFPPETCLSVYQATDGVPRLINQVCDHALLLAYAGGRRQLEPAQVEEAWADLQQLPAPWTAAPRDEQDNGVVEFGGLDEAPAKDRQPAETVSVPALRISPQSEQSETPGSEPAERLQGIEQMLDTVEADFQPAGSIAPEVELVFDDPFREEFEREEVVADRCARAAALPERPTPEADQPEKKKRPEMLVGGDREPTDADHGEPGRVETGLGREPAIGSEVDEPLAGPDELVRETVPLRRGEPAEEMDDDETILVEDDYDEIPATACSIVAVRHQQYGRLFSRLRRG